MTAYKIERSLTCACKEMHAYELLGKEWTSNAEKYCGRACPFTSSMSSRPMDKAMSDEMQSYAQLDAICHDG